MTGEGPWTLAGEAAGGWSVQLPSLPGPCSGLSRGALLHVTGSLGDCPDTAQAEHPRSWPSHDNLWNWDLGLEHTGAF